MSGLCVVGRGAVFAATGGRGGFIGRRRGQRAVGSSGYQCDGSRGRRRGKRGDGAAGRQTRRRDGAAGGRAVGLSMRRQSRAAARQTRGRGGRRGDGRDGAAGRSSRATTRFQRATRGLTTDALDHRRGKKTYVATVKRKCVDVRTSTGRAGTSRGRDWGRGRGKDHPTLF